MKIRCVKAYNASKDIPRPTSIGDLYSMVYMVFKSRINEVYFNLMGKKHFVAGTDLKYWRRVKGYMMHKNLLFFFSQSDMMERKG
jgi:hypothetical protein